MPKDPFQGLDLSTWFTDKAHPAKDLQALFSAYRKQNELTRTYPRLNFAVDLTLALADRYCTVAYYPAGISYGPNKGLQKKDRVTVYFHKGALLYTVLRVSMGFGDISDDLFSTSTFTSIERPATGDMRPRQEIYQHIIARTKARLSETLFPCPSSQPSYRIVTEWKRKALVACGRCPNLFDCTLNNHPTNTALA